jgi:hypothetical protein
VSEGVARVPFTSGTSAASVTTPVPRSVSVSGSGPILGSAKLELSSPLTRARSLGKQQGSPQASVSLGRSSGVSAGVGSGTGAGNVAMGPGGGVGGVGGRRSGGIRWAI